VAPEELHLLRLLDALRHHAQSELSAIAMVALVMAASSEEVVTPRTND